jgi:hypothetical protein
MRWKLAVPFGVVALSVVMASSAVAAPTPVLDQEQTGHDIRAWSDEMTIAQTLTAGLSGELSTISLFIDSTRDYDPVKLGICTVSSNEPDCSGGDLATSPLPSGYLALADFALSTEIELPSWVDFTFANPPTVAAGAKYAIVLRPSYGVIRFAGSDAYAGGRAYFGSTAGWEDLSGYYSDHGDMAFRTYVQASTPTDPPTQAAQTVAAATLAPTSTVGSSSGSAPLSSLPLALGSVAALVGVGALTLRTRRMTRAGR